MHHGCYHLCPKVREQLRRAREQAGEQPEERDSSSDSKLSNVAGPSKDQRAVDISKRSKESRKLPPGTSSHTKIGKSPRRSHESAYRQNEQHPSGRISPTKSPDASRKFDPEKQSRRSKDSKKTSKYPSSRETPVGSPDASRKFDPEKRSHRRSKDSQRAKEYPSSRGSPIRSPDASVRFSPDKKSHRRSQENGQKTPRSIRNEQKNQGEYRSETSVNRDKIPYSTAPTKSYKKSERKGREFDDGAGSSGRHKGVKDFSSVEFDDFEESTSAHDLCDSHCRGINERMRKLRDENQRQALDEYLVYKGLPYFGDLCTCCCQCLAKQLWNDHFVKSTVTSAALFADLCTCCCQCLAKQLWNDHFINSTVISAAPFAVGFKLCSDLNRWTIPNVF